MTDYRRDAYIRFLRAADRARAMGASINPQAAAGQACLESAYGTRTPPASNNVLGIKVGSTWDGPAVNAGTHEYTSRGDLVSDVNAWWRVYPSLEACFADYGSLISRLWWYADAAAQADGLPETYLEALKPRYDSQGRVVEPGYFTDPNYVEKVMAIVRAYQPTFEERYPALEGVHELWVNNEHVGDILKARQVGGKLFVNTLAPLRKETE